MRNYTIGRRAPPFFRENHLFYFGMKPACTAHYYFIENVAVNVVQSMATSAPVKLRVHTREPGAVSLQLLSGVPYSRSIDGGRVNGCVASMQPDHP